MTVVPGVVSGICKAQGCRHAVSRDGLCEVHAINSDRANVQRREDRAALELHKLRSEIGIAFDRGYSRGIDDGRRAERQLEAIKSEAASDWTCEGVDRA